MSYRKVELKSYKKVAKEDEEDEEVDIIDTEITDTHSSTYSAELIAAFSANAFRKSEQAQVIKNRQKGGKINKKEAISEYTKAYETIAHTLDKDALESQYNTSLRNGLTTETITAAHNDPSIGFNELIPPKRDPEWLRFLKCTFGNLLSVFWSAAAILAIILYCIDPRDPPDDNALFLGIFLILVVVLTGLFIFYVDGKASSLMSALSSIEPISVIVLRNNGIKTAIDPKYLVPGDIVHLSMGLSIPADMRIIECSSDFEVDNSSLTGESEPQQRFAKKENMDIIPAESNNLVFYGTFVLNGYAIGCVIATGNHTFMGRTAALASYTEEEITPLMAEINDLVKKLSVFASIIGLVVFIPSMVISPSAWMRNLMILISLIITNIPGGLLVVTCIQLTLTAKVLYNKNVQIKQLGSVETLGSATVICSDKTGTLTTNVMTVQHIYYNLKQRICDTLNPLHALKGDFYDDQQREIPNQDFLRLVRCGILCNNASFLEKDGAIDPTANATEAAILKFSSGHIVSHYKQNVEEYRKSYRKLHEIPFNSKNKWQVSVHEDQKQSIVQMKGAPERILHLCDRHMVDGKIQSLNDDMRTQIMDGIVDLGSKGERVLAFAELILNDKDYDINITEPMIEAKYEEEIDEKYATDDAVLVCYNEQRIKININIADYIEEEKEQIFERCTVEILMKCIEKQIDNIPIASQRIAYSDYGLLSSDLSFKELGIKRGAVLYLWKGPYKFQGTCVDDVNWPFNRDGDKEGLVFIGLYAMIDPPRAGVPEAVSVCRTAGIKVIMVTGDHPVTAKAIAEAVGIISDTNKDNAIVYDSKTMDKNQFENDEFNALVIPGWELQKVLDGEPDDAQSVANFWNHVLNCDDIVFARTSPQQKLLIVSAVQERGAIVAVTGDGVNDSPALKKANIGVAMGITGTEVAKESANMILLDDNFSTILVGIKQGRIIFDNLKKSVSYSLGKCMAQVMPFVVTVAFGLPLPLTPLLLLTIDGGTDMIPAISLCFEEDEADIMKRRPRNALKEHLATLKLIFNTHLVYGIFGACAGLYGYFTVLHSYGYLPQHVINHMDQYSIFSYNGDRNADSLRDGYHIWCFKPEVTDKCYYYPNFYNGTLVNTASNNIGYYYDQNQWYLYQKNGAEYAQESKQYLVNQNVNGLTLNALNGRDRNGVMCCNVDMNDDECEQPSESLCNEDYLDWNSFYTEYWSPVDNNATYDGLLHIFNDNVFTNALFPTRRCWAMDYFSLYTEFKDQPITTCNWISNEHKPRTYIGINSLFPMQTRARTEALSRAQTALVMGIFFMQLAHLLTVRTRRSSIFQQGMNNEFMNYGLFCQIFLIAFIIYMPFMNTLLGSEPLRFVFWTPSWPFVVFILFFHECRKSIVRRKTKSKFVDFVTRNTYW